MKLRCYYFELKPDNVEKGLIEKICKECKEIFFDYSYHGTSRCEKCREKHPHVKKSFFNRIKENK